MSRAPGSSIIAKSSQVIDVITAAHRPLSFSEIVAGTGLVKSSCHRILAVLQGEHMIDYDKRTRIYRSGPRLQKWARAVWNRADIQQAAGPYMADLCDKTQMNTALSILDGNSLLYLRTVDFFNARFASHAGDRAPLHATAAGKVFLAHMSPSRLDVALEHMEFETFTPNTLKSAQDVREQCPAIREAGYAQADREEAPKVTGIAAPIWNTENKHVACLSLWSTTQTHDVAQVQALSDLLIEATQRISADLGAVLP